MSIPNEALQKLVQEIESRAIFAQQQVNIVKSQIAGKERDARMQQLTLKEINDLPPETKVYEGVGRMFVCNSTSEIGKRLITETESLKSDIESLNKKLVYLETTHKNSKEHIDQIFKSKGRA
ncbi:MAG: hypothetical protein M1834_001820 [Cirrosporium novae-zelandiae]|nr:MAG: hypothetical protein M1834_001820 [Cirrosporium novae-zelandiae]